jgi:transcriptional regulator with XRE-family HTH domain
VRELRSEHGLSQEALAEAAGIHVTYLSGIESGKRNPSLDIINALAAAFEVGALELLRRASPD